jgi:hypothetical protein
VTYEREHSKWYEHQDYLDNIHLVMFSGNTGNQFGGDVLSICFKKDFKHLTHLSITEPTPGHLYLACPEDEEEADFFYNHINIQELLLECILDSLEVEFVFITDILGDTFQVGFTLQREFSKCYTPPHPRGCIYHIYTGNIADQLWNN